MKKINMRSIARFLALILILQSSCRSWKNVQLTNNLNGSEKKKEMHISGLKKGDELRILTTDSTKYRFQYYYAQNNNLIGYKLKHHYKESEMVQPIDSILRLDKRKNTGAKIVGATFFLGIVGIIVFAATFEGPFGR